MISLASSTYTPVVLNPQSLSQYSASQDGGSIVHRILGRVAPDVTLRPSFMRVGSFVIDFPDENAAAVARQLLARPGEWHLIHTARPSVAMIFIVQSVRLELNGDGRWMLSVNWEETDHIISATVASA